LGGSIRCAIDNSMLIRILFKLSERYKIPLCTRRKLMLYFVKQNTVHTYPVAKRCTAVYQREQLRDTWPRSVHECPYCMKIWPGDKD